MVSSLQTNRASSSVGGANDRRSAAERTLHEPLRAVVPCVSKRVVPSEMDVDHLGLIRSSVEDFMSSAAGWVSDSPGRLLDIAPQDHAGARPFFPAHVLCETLDINPAAGCTYTGDICKENSQIPSGRFDYVVCTEVLEHTRRPFDAAKELYRLLRPGGLLFVSTPFNFRIHGPLPDCWRFTEYGLRELLSDFELVELCSVSTPDRTLMPIHYTVIARKPQG